MKQQAKVVAFRGDHYFAVKFFKRTFLLQYLDARDCCPQISDTVYPVEVQRAGSIIVAGFVFTTSYGNSVFEFEYCELDVIRRQRYPEYLDPAHFAIGDTIHSDLHVGKRDAGYVHVHLWLPPLVHDISKEILGEKLVPGRQPKLPTSIEEIYKDVFLYKRFG